MGQSGIVQDALQVLLVRHDFCEREVVLIAVVLEEDERDAPGVLEITRTVVPLVMEGLGLLGVGAQTAVATDLLVQPGDALVLAVPRGCTHVAAIQLAAAGVVIVSPVEDC